jgi:hypothetical protein
MGRGATRGMRICPENGRGFARMDADTGFFIRRGGKPGMKNSLPTRPQGLSWISRPVSLL